MTSTKFPDSQQSLRQLHWADQDWLRPTHFARQAHFAGEFNWSLLPTGIRHDVLGRSLSEAGN